MQHFNSILKKSFHIRSESIGEQSSSVLLLETGKAFFSFAKMEAESGTLKELGYFESEDELEDLVTKVFELHKDLMHQYRHTAVSYWSPESMLIPSQLYNFADVSLHLDAIYGSSGNSHPLSESVHGWDIHNVYRMESPGSYSIERRLKGIKYFHHYTLILNNVGSVSPETMLVDFRRDEFSVLAFGEKQLLLAQTFAYSTPEDVLYYLLKISAECNLSQPGTRMILSGWIDRNSPLSRELNKYFIKTEFETLPAGISLDEVFNEYPPHFFSSMCKLAKCVL